MVLKMDTQTRNHLQFICHMAKERILAGAGDWTHWCVVYDVVADILGFPRVDNKTMELALAKAEELAHTSQSGKER